MDNELQKDRLVWMSVVWALVFPIKISTSTDPMTWSGLMTFSGLALAAAWVYYFRKPDPAEDVRQEQPECAASQQPRDPQPVESGIDRAFG
jgi:hypothetical protein